MRELSKGAKAVRRDHKEVMNKVIIKRRTYPTQEAKSRRGTGVGVS